MRLSTVTMQARRNWLWLIPLLLVTFWLGVHYLDARPLWRDETFSLRDAGIGTRTPVDIWNEVAERNPWHPPGFFILLNLWGNLIGSDQAVLRLLSLFFGVLAVAWTYRLGRDNVNESVGLFAAAILGTTVMLAYYLDQIRVYTLLMLLTTVTLWQYLRILRLPRPRRRDWILLCLSVAAMLYAHYFSAIILGAIGLYHLIFVRKDRRWWVITDMFMLAGILFLPWISVLFRVLFVFFGPIQFDFNDRALGNSELVSMLALLFSNGLIVLLVAALALALVGRLRGGWRFWFFAAATFIPLLVLNGLFQMIPMSRLRYLLMLWPLFALVVALGLAWLAQRGVLGRWLSAALLLVWMVAGLTNVTNPELTNSLGGGIDVFPFQKVDRAIRSHAAAGDLIVDFWSVGRHELDPNVLRYYDARLPTKAQILTTKPGEKHAVDPDEVARHDRVWVSYVPERPVEEAQALTDLQTQLQSYALCAKPVNSPALSISLYARTPVCCGPDDQPVADFGGGAIVLTGIDGLAVEDEDDSPDLTLGWSIRADVPIHVYSATLQLFDSSGNKVGQNDYGLEPVTYACQTSSFDVGSLPTGVYELRAGVYAWKTGQRLPGMTAGGKTGDLLPVGTLRISNDDAKGS